MHDDFLIPLRFDLGFSVKIVVVLEKFVLGYSRTTMGNSDLFGMANLDPIFSLCLMIF